VIEHIKGAEQVVSDFFSWLKPKGLLVLVFPDRDTVFGLFIRLLPHWVHLMYYKYLLRSPNAGKPGYGPFRTYYDGIVSRRAMRGYCHRNGHEILVEFGRPYNLKGLGLLGWVLRVIFKIFQVFSLGRLAADHSGLVFVIQKR